MRFAVIARFLPFSIHARWLQWLAASGTSCLFAVIAIAADDFPVPTQPTGPVAPGALAKRSDVAKDPQKPSEQRIDQLIHDLGSPQFPIRRAAGHELRQIGAEAFDQLYAATDSPDPEIAATAGYLLRQVPVRWFQPEDPNMVRSVMRLFGQETDAARLQRIEQLAKVPGGAAVPALCRIARYDRSPLVSRSAALAIIRPDDKPGSDSHIDPEVITRELGRSKRASAALLRQYLAQLRDPASSISAWTQLIEQETEKLHKNYGDTSGDIVLGLCWNLADLHRQLGDRAALSSMLDRMIDLAADGSDETLASLIEWLTEYKSWDALDAFITKHRARLEQSKTPLYYAAIARAKQGKQDAAEELAAKAAALEPQQPFDTVTAGNVLEKHSQFKWAVREYRRAIEKQPANSAESVLAQLSLSSMLHDYEHEKEAADTLESLVKNLRGGGTVAQLYSRVREYYASRDPDDASPFRSPEEIAAKYHHYRACQYEQEKDWQRARTALTDAIKSDPTDADVLINMYHLPESDGQWRNNVMKQVQKLVDQFQHEIDENPNDPSPYNQWAWLVANTEGDFQKAVRYSHRSLELNNHGESGAASFLDTLGRCYYAAGDYKNAVKYERQAIEKNDYLQVMRRQLALFEKALAEQEQGGKQTKPAQ